MKEKDEKMKTFSVFRHPFHGWEAVAEGWNWWAFFLGPFWLLACGLWEQMLALGLLPLAGIIMDSVTPFMPGGLGRAAMVLLASCISGANGNKWRVARLKKRGYVEATKLQASSKATALASAMRQAGLS